MVTTKKQTMNAIEIQQDEIYAEAYKKAENAFNKKYNKLLYLTAVFFRNYESNFGEPDINDESNADYFKLQKIVEKYMESKSTI